MTPLRTKEAIAALPSKPVLDVNYLGSLSSSMGSVQTKNTTWIACHSSSIKKWVIGEVYSRGGVGDGINYLNRLTSVSSVTWQLSASSSSEQVEGRIGMKIGSAAEILYPVRTRNSSTQTFTEYINIVDSAQDVVLTLYLRRLTTDNGSSIVAMGTISSGDITLKIPVN